MLAASAPGTLRPVASPYNECCAAFSPNGEWLAYVSDETGRINVYVSPYRNPEVKWLVSAEDGGGEPLWSRDGTELFYRSGPKMIAVSVQTQPSFSVGRPDVLFEGLYATSTNPRGMRYYDLSPDGKQFLMVQVERQNQINVVLNWFEELKRLVPNH